MHPLKFVPVSFGTIEIFDDRVAYQGNSIPRYRLLSIIKNSIVTTLATTERSPFQVYTRNCLIWYKYYITKAFFVHVTIPPWRHLYREQKPIPTTTTKLIYIPRMHCQHIPQVCSDRADNLPRASQYGTVH